MILRARGLRRSIALLIAAPLVIASLAGCASSSPDAGGGPTTITFSYLWGGPEGKAMEKIIAAYNASQKSVIVKGVSSPDTQKQLTSMSSSTGSFDISDNFGQTVGAWASKGIIAPLDEYIAAEKIDTGDFAASAMDQVKYEGKTYALPIAVHTFQLLYNKTLLDAAGIAPPTTMDELSTAAAALTTTDADGKISVLGLGAPNDAATLTTLGFAFGGAWDGKTGPTPDAAANVKALSWYQDNVVNAVGPGKLADFVAGQGQYLSAQDPFYSGTIAMAIDGEWRSASANAVAPGLDWGVTAIPAVSTSLTNSTQVTSSTLFIPTNSRHKEAAGAFLAYLVGPKAMTEFTLALGNLPSRTSLLDSSAYAKLPNFGVWATALTSPNARSLASKPYSAEYAADLDAAFDQVVRSSATPKQALKQVTSRVPSYAKR
jgi:multiple sugar transport system substrate-binding protein